MSETYESWEARQKRNEKERKAAANAQADALAAEDTAVFNLGEIRKLGQRVDGKTDALAHALADARRGHADLLRLVERMGRVLEEHKARERPHRFPYLRLLYPLTIIGQREYDAAMHDAEGPDVRREDCVP